MFYCHINKNIRIKQNLSTKPIFKNNNDYSKPKLIAYCVYKSIMRLLMTYIAETRAYMNKTHNSAKY